MHVLEDNFGNLAALEDFLHQNLDRGGFFFTKAGFNSTNSKLQTCDQFSGGCFCKETISHKADISRLTKSPNLNPRCFFFIVFLFVLGFFYDMN